MRFRQWANAFLQCSKWLTRFTPFFTAEERKHAGVQQRLLDANRTISQPNKLTLIFGRRITRHHAGKLQTVIEDLNLPNPVIRRSLPQGLPQAIRPRSLPPPHQTCNQQYLYRLRYWQGGGESSSIAAEARRHHRPLSRRATRYSGDLCGPRGTSPTQPIHASSQRQTHPWSEAGSAPTVGLMHSLVLLLPHRRRHLHHPRLIPANPAGTPASTGRVQVGSLRYDLWKLRAKHFVGKIPHSRRYRLLPHGYQICLVFLKLYEKIYAPLTAGILHPLPLTDLSQRKDHRARSSIYRRHSGTRRSRRGRRLESRLAKLEAKLSEGKIPVRDPIMGPDSSCST